MPEFCPRCFWFERNIDKPPSLFPGIFSSIDAITRRSTRRSFLKRKKIPGWLPIPDIIGVEEGDTYFKLPVSEGDWILIGKPDDIFKTKNNTYHIVDYKTAKFTGRQDELFPLYEVQLNAYAYLAEKYGFRPISDLSLIYCEPSEDLDDDEDFRLTFKPYRLEIDLNLDRVRELLLEAREIAGRKEPPESIEDCKGICKWIDSENGVRSIFLI